VTIAHQRDRDVEKPVTLPRLQTLAQVYDDSDEQKAIAADIASRRIVREGREAWQLIHKAESFEAWKAIGAALAIGRDHALKSTGANRPMGRRYSWAFSAWAKSAGFHGMRPATRSWALALHENGAAIEQWRSGLTERERKRLINPQSCVKRWQRTQGNGYRCPQDLKTEAVAAWRRFVRCVSAMPADQAAQVWEAVRNETPAAPPRRS